MITIFGTSESWKETVFLGLFGLFWAQSVNHPSYDEVMFFYALLLRLADNLGSFATSFLA